MQRSILNSVFFTLLYGALPLQLISLWFEQWTAWFLLCLPIIFVFVKRQPYVYEKTNEIYFRRAPFFQGTPITQLRHMGDLRLVDTASTIQRLWVSIEEFRP